MNIACFILKSQLRVNEKDRGRKDVYTSYVLTIKESRGAWIQ